MTNASGVATLDVLDYQTGELVVDSYNLNDRFMSGDERMKMLMPDTIYYRAYDSALYMAARGPSPVSAVKPENFNPNATAGLFKLSLTDCIDPAYGNDAFLLTEARRVPVGSSDVHGVRGVGPTDVGDRPGRDGLGADVRDLLQVRRIQRWSWWRLGRDGLRGARLRQVCVCAVVR